MEQLDQISALIAITLGVGWASGINLYAAIATLGILGLTGYADLPPGLEVLQDPLVIMAAGFMYFLEFIADKVPGVDTGWDGLHTFIRIPAGAALAAAAVTDMGTGVELAAALVGGGLAATTHATKSGSRVLINTSPEPFTNWFASIGEDLLVIAGLWTALQHPLVFLVLLVIMVALMIWLLPKLWRAIKFLAARVKAIFTREPVPEAPQLPDFGRKS